MAVLFLNRGEGGEVLCYRKLTFTTSTLITWIRIRQIMYDIPYKSQEHHDNILYFYIISYNTYI